MSTANEKLLDASIRHAVFLERFKGSEAKRLGALYRQLEGDLIAQLARRDPTGVQGRYRRMRMHILLEDVKEILKAFGAKLQAETLEMLEELGDIEADFAVRAIITSIPIAVEVVRPTAAQVRAAMIARPFDGSLLKEYYSGLEAVAQTRFRAAIRMGVLQGETIDQIAVRLRNAGARSRRGAELVARTAVSHVSAVARQMTYAENDDIVKALRWVSTLDSRTSAVCRARDGKTYPLGSESLIPAHWGCRSSFSPILKSWREMGIDLDDAPEGTRASMDGQVPASTTYSDWLKTRPAAEQDEILGKAKGALFRKGGLTLDKFVARDGSELNLKQLRARYAEAFSKAGV